MYTPYGVSHRSSFSFVSLWLPVKPAVINLAVEFAALVNFIASVTLYTVANFREKRRLKKQRKEEKAAQKG
ncbi:Uncharacterised protein [Klebsiella michiganensis]|uniref:Uncharacterized protein n=1 Tax=Klebsiella michiganensis TaxID=1134687 RepID=A0A7H4MSS2_9ENTR|nr:Uncharacterised protein [Klebsiella michiganensis]